MELLKNARLSSAESKLEASLGSFRRVSTKKEMNEKRSSSIEQIKGEQQQKRKELYTNEELTNLKKVIKKNPFDITSQVFMREVRKQEAQQNQFAKDGNNYLNRSTYRSYSKRGKSEDESTCIIRSGSMNNLNSVNKQRITQPDTIYGNSTMKHQNILYTNINEETQMQQNNNSKMKFLNKNMSARFTNKGAARNFECLKYRIVKYQENEDILEQKKYKGQGYKMNKTKDQTPQLKQQLTSALIQLKEFKDSEEIDKAVTQISKRVDNSAKKIQRSLTDKTTNLGVKNQNYDDDQDNENKKSSFFASQFQSSQKPKTPNSTINKNEQIKRETQEDSPWMTCFTSRKTMINEIKQLNKNLYEMKQNKELKEHSQYKSIIKENHFDSNQYSTQKENNKKKEGENDDEKQGYQQKIDPNERPIYFDVNTGKRQLGVTESERKLFANFLADKNLNVLLYCRKFDVEPNGHLKKHLMQITQQNTVNQQIRIKFNQQMLDDSVQTAIKKEQRLLQQNILQQSANKTTLSAMLAGEFTPGYNNQSNQHSRLTTQNQSPSKSRKENDNLSSRRSSILIEGRSEIVQGTATSLVRKNNNENQFVSVGQFLKQNDHTQPQNYLNKRSQSASIIKSRKINSLIHQQAHNIIEMRQISQIRQKSSLQNDTTFQSLIKTMSPVSKLYIPLASSEQQQQYKQKLGNQDKSPQTLMDPSPNVLGIKSISPIKRRGESTQKYSTQSQIYDTNTFDIKTKSNEELSKRQQSERAFSNFSQAYQIKMSQEQEKDSFIGFTRKNNRKPQTQVLISEVQKNGGNKTHTHKSNIMCVQQVRGGSQTTKNISQSAQSLAHIQEFNTINQLNSIHQLSSQNLANKSRTIVIQHFKKSQQLLNTLFEEQKHQDLAHEQDNVLLEKYKYLVSSDKMTRINLKKERRKQKGISQKLPKKMFDEIGFVYGRNPFLKFKPSKLMKIRLSIIKYLQKVKLLNININEIVEKKIYPLNPYERPGAYIFLNLCKSGTYLQIEEILKNNQYHVNDFNELNQTGLHIAAYNDNTDICLVLLKYFSDPDLIDSTGKTPLFYALRNKNHLLVRHLFFYRSIPWSRQNLRYSDIEMDDEMKQIFDAARVVHFMIQLPYDYNEKVWDVFLKDPIPKMLNSDSEDDQEDQGVEDNEDQDVGQEYKKDGQIDEQLEIVSFSNLQNSKQISSKHNKFQSQSSLLSHHNQNQKYASMNSISPFNERQSIEPIPQVKNNNKGQFQDDQDQYYNDLFRAQNYS